MKKALSLLLTACLLTCLASAQHKISMNVKDLNSTIEKYIEKNYAGYKTVEAFKYDVIYETVIHKADTSRNLVFDADGKFLYKEAEADKAKMPMQTRTTIALKDVKDDITKYLAKKYKGYKLTEAYKYEKVYSAKVVNGQMAETIFFDKDGAFLMESSKAPVAHHDAAPKAPAETAKPDSSKK
jgi:hypothetical protein